MKGKTHGTIGAASFVYLCSILPGKFKLINLIFAILGSLLPDIDHHKSLINKYLLPIRNGSMRVFIFLTLGIIVLYIDSFFTASIMLKIIGISLILISLSTHRTGFTHSIFGLIMFNITIRFLSNLYNFIDINLFFTIGFLLHLLGDMCTKRGIPLFYPLSNKKHRMFITYSSGKSLGNFIEGILIILSIAYIICKLPTFF